MSRRGYFAFATLAISLALIELGGRLIEWVASHADGPHESSNPYISLRNREPVFETAVVEGRKIYQRTPHHWIHPDQEFTARKSPDTIRIFALGGSAAQGWPHPPDWSYPAILRRQLSKSYPDRTIEVLNVAGNTYASYRVKVVFEEALRYEPDLILVYSGNNEFLEDFLYRVDRLPAPWRHSAVVRLIGRALPRDAPKHIVDVTNYGAADQVANRLSFAFGRESPRRSDPQQFRTVIDHYRYNLDQMLASARDAGVAVMLLDVPVNLKDWRPNVSRHRPGLTDTELRSFVEYFRRGFLASEANEYEVASQELRGALAIDDTFAEAHYLRARALLQLQSIDEARSHFELALAHDAYPFRSLPEFAVVRRELAQQYRAPHIEISRLLEARTADGIIGFDTLVDYVHPTVASNRVIARAVLETMDEAGLLPAARAITPAEARVNVPAHAEETLGVLLSLYNQFLVMRQYDGLESLSQRILRAADRNEARGAVSPRYSASTIRQFLSHTTPVLRRYQRLSRAEMLGIREQEFSAVEAQQIHHAYVEMIRQLEARHLRPEEFLEWVPERTYRDGQH